MIRYLLVLLILESSDSTPTSGPYKVTNVLVKDCDKPRRPYIDNPAIIFKAFLKNTTKDPMIMVNLTILRNINDMKLKLNGLIERNGNLEKYLIVNNLDCHYLLMQFIQAAINVKVDRKTCTYFKGSYSFRSLDTNKMHHVWEDAMEYGRILWRVEATVPAGTMFCSEIYTVVEPA